MLGRDISHAGGRARSRNIHDRARPAPSMTGSTRLISRTILARHTAVVAADQAAFGPRSRGAHAPSHAT
jgi:hypothetical protein